MRVRTYTRVHMHTARKYFRRSQWRAGASLRAVRMHAGGGVLAPASLVAAVGLVASVHPTKAGERASGGKNMAALIAAKGFLARMQPTMDSERAAAAKP